MNADKTGDRIRLDELLVRRGLFATRSRARDAVVRATVRVDGRIASKPGAPVASHAELNVADPASRYVSRAALKLVAGLDRFGFDPAGLIALDLGASTGGFTQVLLDRGATKVFAVDVGNGQMAPVLRADKRVVLREGLNARDLETQHLDGEAPQALVSDVSFISLRLALPPALALAAPGAFGLFLVKPQFEVGRAAIGRGGKLRDPAGAEAAASALADWLDGQAGWRVLGLDASPLAGGEGAREFLLAAIRDR